MLRTIHDFKSLHLRAKDGDIGHVQEFYFDDESWVVRYLVADTGGWLTGRRVLISPHALKPVNEADHALPVALSKKQITDSPLTDSDLPVSRQFEAEYQSYYGWPGNWGAGTESGLSPYFGLGNPLSPTAIDDAAAPPHAHSDPHLRSTRDVTGHHLSANDGEIGHVTDFLIDDETWKVAFLIVDTNAWWPGKKVLISPKWITQIDWGSATVVVNVTRDQVRAAPDYTPEKTVGSDHEKSLHHHYELRKF